MMPPHPAACRRQVPAAEPGGKGDVALRAGEDEPGARRSSLDTAMMQEPHTHLYQHAG